MPDTVRNSSLAGLAALLVIAVLTIAGAWGFELIGGYVPCALCLQERIPYYLGIPAVLISIVAIHRAAPLWLQRLLVLLVALIFAGGAGLGIYHAGAEWGFWPGPADCSAGAAPPTDSAADLLSQLEGMRIVSCTEASWRFPADWGLSFAGWNAAISIALASIALLSATRLGKPRT